MYPCLCLCHCLCHRLCLLVVTPSPLVLLTNCQKGHTSTVLWRRWNKESHTHSPTEWVTMSLIVVMPENVRCFVRALCLFSPFHIFVSLSLCNSYSDGNMRQIFGSLKCALAEVLVGRVSIVCKLSSLRLFPPTYSATSTFHGNCLTCNQNSFNPNK